MPAVNSQGRTFTAKPTPGFLDVAGAAFERFNLVGEAVTRAGIAPDSFWRQLQRPEDVAAVADGWDSIARTLGSAWEPYLERLAPMRNPQEYAQEQALIIREAQNDQIISQAGGTGIALMLTFGLLDPLMFAPAAAGPKGLSLARRFAIAGGLVGAGQEAVLQTIDPDRTALESFAAIGTIALVSGILGKGVSLTRGRGQMQKIADDIDLQTRTDMPPTRVENSSELVKPTKAKELPGQEQPLKFEHREWDLDKAGIGGDVLTRPQRVLGGKLDRLGVEGKIAKATSIGWLHTSPSAPAREVAEQAFSSGVRLEGVVGGRATAQAVETEVDSVIQTFNGKMLQAHDNFYVQYRTGVAGGSRRDVAAQTLSDIAIGTRRELRDVVNKGLSNVDMGDLVSSMKRIPEPEGGFMTVRQFDDAVHVALANGGEHAIPEVSAFARWQTKNFYDPLYQRALDSGVVTKESAALNNNQSYLHRVYTIEKIRSSPGEWDALVRRSLSRDLDSQAAAALNRGEDFVRPTTEQIDEMLEGIRTHMLHNSLGRGIYEPLGVMDKTVRGALADRTLDFIDDADLLAGGWLDTDVTTNARHYTRTLVPDTLLKERFGSVGMDSQIRVVQADWQQRIANRRKDNPIRAGESAGAYDSRMSKYARQMDKAMQGDITRIERGRDMLRGTFVTAADPQSMVWRTLRVMRNFNVLRLGGGFTVSSIVDLARPAMVHGARRAYGTQFKLMRQGMEAINLSAQDSRIVGVGFELSVDTRAMSFADVGDQFGRGSVIERVAQSATNKFFIANLLAPWNHSMKQWAFSVGSARMLDTVSAVAKTGKAATADMQAMLHLGIDAPMANRIAAQFKKHGATFDGVKIAQLSEWTDQGAVRAFSNALKKDVDSVIVTPGVLDKPTFFHTELGKTVGQFKSFAFASTNHIFLSGLQQADMNTLNGVALSLFLGGGVYAMKQKLNGKPLGEPEDFIWNSIDRSGMLGILTDANNTAEKVFGIGVSSFVPGGTQRYSRFGALGAVVGPTGGLFEDATTAFSALLSGDRSPAEARATLRMVPYRNLFYFQGFTNKLAEAYAR